MSDYISSIDNYRKFSNNIFDHRIFAPYECISNHSDVNRFEAYTGVERDVYSQHVDQRRCSQERHFFQQDSIHNSKNSLIKSIDISDLRELERLSANLIQLLKEARQNSIKVISTCNCAGRHVFSRDPTLQRESLYSNARVETERFLEKLEKDHQKQQNIHAPQNVDRIQDQFDNSAKGTTSTSGIQNADDPVSSTVVSGNTFSATGLVKTPLDENEKDRRRKIKHDKKEKKKRSIVQNKLSELGGFVPNNAKNMKRSTYKEKGADHYKSPDYNNVTMQTDHDQVKLLQEKVDDTDRELRNLVQRIEQLETRLPRRFQRNTSCEDQLSEENNLYSTSLPPYQPNRNVQEHPQNILSTVSQILPLNDSFDALSTPYSVESVSSSMPSSCSSGMDIGDMDCYL